MLETQSTKIIFPKCFVVVIEPIIYITNFNVGFDNFSWIRVWEYLEISMILSKYLKNDTESVGCNSISIRNRWYVHIWTVVGGPTLKMNCKVWGCNLSQ